MLANVQVWLYKWIFNIRCPFIYSLIATLMNGPIIYFFEVRYPWRLTCKAFYTNHYEGFSKFVIKKLKKFHGLFAIQMLKSLMCTRMQSQFLSMVLPFFILQKFFIYFFVEKTDRKLTPIQKFFLKNLKRSIDIFIPIFV